MVTCVTQVLGGMEVFASGLRGLGGEAGGDIAAAFTDAASAGAIGLSEAAVGYVTALQFIRSYE